MTDKFCTWRTGLILCKFIFETTATCMHCVAILSPVLLFICKFCLSNLTEISNLVCFLEKDAFLIPRILSWLYLYMGFLCCILSEIFMSRYVKSPNDILRRAKIYLHLNNFGQIWIYIIISVWIHYLSSLPIVRLSFLTKQLQNDNIKYYTKKNQDWLENTKEIICPE